jgi:hypothetical protein
MNGPLFKATVAFFPASLLLSGSAILWFRGKTLYGFMQLFGAGCMVMVVLTHVCEALNLFPSMHWGLEHSAGHYIDLAVAVSVSHFFLWATCFMRSSQPKELDNG